MNLAAGPTFLERFVHAAQTDPGHPAVVVAGTTTSYGELLGLARRIAQSVYDARPRGRVLIHLPQGPAAYAAMYGCAMAAATYAPVNVAAPFERLAGVAARFDPDIVLTSAAGAADGLALAALARDAAAR